MTVKVVGYQWKWSYDYLDDEVFFYSTLTTPPEQIGSLLGFGPRVHATTEVVRNEHYLQEVDEPLVVPVGKKVRLLLTAADVPALVGRPGAGRQAGRHPRHRPRGLVPRREGGDLPRPVHRAVRQEPRLHADRRRGGQRGRI